MKPETNLSGLQRFTDNAKQAMVHAHELADRYKNQEVQPIHLFIALISKPSALINKVMEKVGLDPEKTKRELMQVVISLESVGWDAKPVFSEKIKELINRSFLIAEEFGHVYVGTEHLLIGMLEIPGEEFIEEMKQLGLTPVSVAETVNTAGAYPSGLLGQSSPNGDLESDSSLPFFCRDMNQQAQRGEFLNITGRDKEIERLIHILARKTKNNPILVGDAGVGKTAVVQGLVQRIMRGEVPPSFLDKQVLSLDVSSIIAGARVRGDVEERILALVNDAIAAQNKIIFIDEIHMIVGSGGYGAKDPMDIGNILKPYLTDPNLRIIGATTVSEYRKYFDDDPALSRRFQPIDVEELDKDSSIEILKALRTDLETYHGVKIKDEAVEEAVTLSSRFITDRYLPDKAIDLIDEAAASVKIGREISIEPALSELGDKLMNAQQSKELAMSNKDLASAYRYQQSESEITEAIAQLVEGRTTRTGKNKIVDANMIRKIVVNWTKIPLAAASEISSEGLDKLRQNLGRHIVGQNHVLEAVSEALKRSHLRLTEHKRPLASFLFLGPTGVGKTELAKSIATELFGSSDLIYQINMSEYMEMHSVAKLIGSPPGYVGYQEGGQLTERVRRRPYTVVLFDEIEKAHPDVLNLLLQILEEGELTDGKGRKANFQNTVVILTSNIGAEEVAKDKHLGFDIEIEEAEKKELDTAFEEMRDSLLESLKEEVRPEILNRLDSVVVFRGLNEQDCLDISKLMLQQLHKELLVNGIDLHIPATAAELVNSNGYSKEYGARNIRRKVQELIENPLADYLVSKKVKRPKKGLLKLKMRVKDGVVSFG
ncbi:MAG: ATP-dependent Clp protease ATP-binding subunit [Candidatus Doudnabacteria bacterium]|nr:ATP-dependent Clp protease ATP-binding subunit [Candidatus Doudnabacteria bacterium]